MKEWHGTLKSKHLFLLVIGLLAATLMVCLFLHFHVPIKGYYDEDRQEVVISPGFLYTLERYEVSEHKAPSFGGTSLLPLSDSSDPEYRFRAIPGKSVEEEIWVASRSILTGKEETYKVRSVRFDFGWAYNLFSVSSDWGKGELIALHFSVHK